MPTFALHTNIPKSKIPPNFLTETSNIVAQTLQKPLQYVIIHIISDQLMCMGGTTEPCGYATLMSIGQLGIEENKKHAGVLYAHLEKQLGIPKDRLYINFIDADRSTVGYQGTTFHDIFGGK